MAKASTSKAQDQFSCPMCLDLLKDPVTTPCGHNFCQVCINRHWDHEAVRGFYHCPQCREIFFPRPDLRRNNMLAEVVEERKRTERQAASSAHCYTGPKDVEMSPAFKKPKLALLCSEHDKPIEIYCRTDQLLVCYLCTMDKHKGHDTIVAKAERTEKQNELKEVQLKSQQSIQEKKKKVEELKQTMDSTKSRSQAAVDDSERIFNELISSIEKKRSEATELIRAQEKAELSQAERRLNQLEQEIADLKRRITDLEQLSHTPDHIRFLQSFPSLCVSPGREDSSSFTVNQHLSFDRVRKSLSNLKKRVEKIFDKEFSKMTPPAEAAQMILPSEPTSRTDFLQYFSYLTLDPNTAHRKIILSEKNRTMRCSGTDQSYPEHPERFDYWSQVLCKESVCGRCYWEVEWSGYLSISVSYKEISRKGRGDECMFGRNSQSWSLVCSSSSSVSFRHNNIETELQVTASSRIGVYVDHSAGTLSFYSVSDTMTLLHTVHTTFTQPLYPGFYICYDSAVKLCNKK